MKKYLNVVMVALVWSLYYVAVGVANKAINPLLTGSIVRVIVFVILSVAMAKTKRLKTLVVPKEALKTLVLIGVMGFLLDITAFIGLKFSSAGIGTVLLKVDIVFICILSALIYKEKIDAIDWAFVALMLVGVMLVMGINPLAIKLKATDLFFLASALCVSINAFLIKHVQTKKDKQNNPISNEVIAYYNNAVAMLFFLIILPFFNSSAPLSGITTQVGFALAIGGLGQLSIYILYYKSLKELPVWLVKTILLLIPIFALVFGWLLFKEDPTPMRLVGTAIVLFSASMILLKQKKAKDKIKIKN